MSDATCRESVPSTVPAHKGWRYCGEPIAASGRCVAHAPPPARLWAWEAVRYLDGDLGDGLEHARRHLRAAAKAASKVVRGWGQGPARVVGTVRQPNGTDKDGLAVYLTRTICEIAVVAELADVGPEKWVRLTTEAGPCAVEVLTTEGGKVTGRVEYHQEDARTVALGYAEEALQTSAGGGGK